MRKDRERAEKRQRNLITVGIVGIVVVLIAVAAFAFKMESDKRAENTYKDAEAVLHEAIEIQKHLKAQDETLAGLVAAAKG